MNKFIYTYGFYIIQKKNKTKNACGIRTGVSLSEFYTKIAII